ncbi:phage holin family protein [Clostridium baratii]|uniref:phage holin family protein n=1 Tax=Clostridium baratii TaxID=1561 RepID=UPI0030CB4037
MFKFIPEVISWLLVLYLLLKLIDKASGILKAIRKKSFKSRIMRDSLIRFAAELLAITFVLIIDVFLNLKYAVIGVTLALFAYKEAGSILENLGECGVILPDIVSEKLGILIQSKNDNKENRNENEENQNNK